MVQKDGAPPQGAPPINSAASHSGEHKPREWLHVIDPPTIVANNSTRSSVYYACECGALHRVSQATFLRRAA
jgi:hypothetical protein